MPMKRSSGLVRGIAIGLFVGVVGVVGNVSTQEKTMDKAIFAGGCFWCIEHLFDEVKGVVSTTSGYIGGPLDTPTLLTFCRLRE